jgi:hypothetical protein
VAVAEELTRRQREIVVLAIGLDKLDERSASSRSSTWLPSNWRPRRGISMPMSIQSAKARPVGFDIIRPVQRR